MFVFQPLDNIYSIYTRGTSWNARHLENFSCLEPPTPPHPKSSHHNWICLHFNIATATDETKSKWNCVFLIFSTQNITSHTSHTSHRISISKCCSPKSVLKCVETFSLLFVCPHFFRIFGPIRPARGRASTHIFECRKTYRTKIPLAWKYLLNPKIICWADE